LQFKYRAEQIALRGEVKWQKPQQEALGIELGLAFDIQNPLPQKETYFNQVYYPAYRKFLEQLTNF